MTEHDIDIETSPELNKFFEAFAKAQGMIQLAAKDAKNPAFKDRDNPKRKDGTSYADLAAVWEACRTALTSNGICVLQVPFNAGTDIGVLTMLGHSSGQWVRGRLQVKPAQFTAQAVGSATTYLRRYCLAAMAGVAPKGDDDDGNFAGSTAPSDDDGTMSAPTPRRQTRQPDPEPAPSDDWKTDARRIAAAIDKAKTHDECDALMADPAIPAIKQASQKAYDALLAKDSTRRAVLDAIPMAAE